MSNVCGNDDVDETAGYVEDDPNDFEEELEDWADHTFGVPDRDYPFNGETAIERPAKKMRFGMQLAPTEGVCRIDDRKWNPVRSWRKHLFKKRGNRLICRRCGFDPDEIPF